MDTNSHECFRSPQRPLECGGLTPLLFRPRTRCSTWLNCLDNFDALRVKDVYAPKRKQGESASYPRRDLPALTTRRLRDPTRARTANHCRAKHDGENPAASCHF